MSIRQGGLLIAGLMILAVVTSGCGKSDDDAAEDTALRFFDSLAEGNSAQCDDTSADFLRLCEGHATRPAFKGAKIDSVHTDSEVLGAPANPYGMVTATVLGGAVGLRLDKPTGSEWRGGQDVSHLQGRATRQKLRRAPRP